MSHLFRARRSTPSLTFPRSWKRRCSIRLQRKTYEYSRCTSARWATICSTSSTATPTCSKIEAGVRPASPRGGRDPDPVPADCLRVQVAAAHTEKHLKLTSHVDPSISLCPADRRAPSRSRLDPLSNAVQFSARRRRGHRGAATSAPAWSRSPSRTPLLRHPQGRCTSSAGRSSRSRNASPSATRARPRSRHLEIARRVARWRRAHPLDARPRHHRRGALSPPSRAKTAGAAAGAGTSAQQLPARPIGAGALDGECGNRAEAGAGLDGRAVQRTRARHCRWCPPDRMSLLPSPSRSPVGRRSRRSAGRTPVVVGSQVDRAARLLLPDRQGCRTCHARRMSLLPSPLKSPVLTTDHVSGMLPKVGGA